MWHVSSTEYRVWRFELGLIAIRYNSYDTGFRDRTENRTKVAPGRFLTFDSARSAAKSLIPRAAQGFDSAKKKSIV